MKNILVIFTFLLSLVLTGCGSNSKPDGTSGGTGGTAANYSLVAVPDVIDISTVGEKKTLKLYLNDNVALQPVEGGVIKANVFDQNFGTLASYSLTTDINGYVGFEYTAPETALPSASLVITFQLEGSVPVLEKNVTISFNGSTTTGTDINTTNYQLVAVPDVVDIATGGESANIDLYLNDMANLVPVSNTVIKAQVFDQTSGTLNTYEVTTDSNGHAPFVYTAPNSLPASSLVITFEVKGGVPALEKDVTISFNGSTTSGTDVNTTNYQLVAVPDVIDIAAGGESANIDLYLNDMANLSAVPNTVIKAQIFDQTNGTLNTYEVTTDSNGHAPFVYTAPNSLPASSLVITFEVKGGVPALEKDVTISFNGSTTSGTDVNTTNYQLVAVPDVIDIAAGGESANIDLYLNDMANLSAVPNTVIKAQIFDQTNGTLNTYEVTTDSNGHAPFVYTAPNSLPASSLVITFEVKGGVPALEKDVTISFNGSTTSGTDVNTTNYQLVAVPDVIDIAAGGESANIDLYLNDMANLSAVPNTVIKAQIFDQTNGTLNTYEVTTDSNGHAPFVYTAPNSLPAGPLVITFEVKGGVPALEKDVTINFSGGTTTGTDVNTTNYQLVAVPDVIDIAAGGDSSNIDLYLNDMANLVPVPNTVIKAQVFDQTNGTLNTYEVTTDSNGHAPFVYTAPNSLPASSLVITFEVKGGVPALEKDVTVNFNGSTSVGTDINTTNYQLVAVPEIVDISTGGESANIDLYLNNTLTLSPVPNTVIKAQVFDQTNGTLSTYEVKTDSNGHAPFVYTAPNSLPALPLVITFEVKGGVPALEKTVTVNFSSTGVSQYEFINVSNIEINHASEKKDLKAQLLYNGVPIAGKTVTMNGFAEGNGTIISGYTVLTDSLGYAVFTYMAPDTLSEVNGTTFAMTIHFDEDTTHLETNLTVTFNETTTTIVNDTTLPIVVIPLEQRVVTLNSNSMTVELALRVYKDITPYTQGSVKVELPAKVLDGVDVGQFDAYEVLVDDLGIATFTYTGPSNLQALISNDDNGSIFKFYHVENTQDKQDWIVEYSLPADPYVSRNYELDVITSNDFSMGIPDKEKTFNVLLKAKDASGNVVALTTENITNITVTTTNGTIAQLFDTNTSTLVDSLSLNPVNNSAFILVSKDKSGLVPLEVTMTFTDINGVVQNLSTIVNVRVFSGPPSAISISYVGTLQDADRAKYIERLAISVTDEYGNRVNTRPNITLGAIVGYTVDGGEISSTETNETRRLFYGKADIDANNAFGEILNGGDSDPSTTSFEDLTAARTDVFQYINAEGNNTDKLVVFGEGKNYEAMGKWDVALGADNHTLVLQDQYYGIDRSGLFYAVGHNYYQDQCRQDGREWIGTTDSDTYQLDEEGTVIIDYKYDYHLTGKDAMIWVNLDGIQPDTGEQTRIGEATKHTLRGNGLVTSPLDGYSLKAGNSGYATFIIWHENAPERYRNAHFSWAVKGGSTCSYIPVATSNTYDARTCNNGATSDGTSYITFYIEAGAQDCTFNITDIMVSDEF
ncbi:hypothetical protein PGH07_03745 [Sulfurovum sp. zt1-1]|uniref:Ig-like domain (Group 1) n=1 Tax=Sulfurovum zhangzhouensis TaxID=3019067 RepID=A0ABT7QY76_9BACT|nr:hypothetical protein [Sulfurovum zhangzhouensis]MDM5271281.1 hypothetical protein [Sulfurovum zhangzhouensis]